MQDSYESILQDLQATYEPITDSLRTRLSALLRDDEDETTSLSRTDSAGRTRPGSITPLGIRVDRGQGLLGSSTAAATLADMDNVISGIRQWHKDHERDLAILKSRHAQALQDPPPSDSTHYSHDHAESQVEFQHADHTVNFDGPPADHVVDGRAPTTENTGVHCDFSSSEGRSQNAANQQRTIWPHRPAAATPNISSPATCQNPIPSCVLRSNAIRPGSAGKLAPLSREATEKLSCLSASVLHQQTPKSGALLLGSQCRIAAAVDPSTPPPDLIQHISTHRLRNTEMQQPPHRPASAVHNTLQSSRPMLTVAAASIEGNHAGQRAVGHGTGASRCSMSQQQRQLLEQLEQELKELDGDGTGMDEVLAWHSEIESTLARMDALQTGYQVQSKQQACSTVDEDEDQQEDGT